MITEAKRPTGEEPRINEILGQPNYVLQWDEARFEITNERKGKMNVTKNIKTIEHRELGLYLNLENPVLKEEGPFATNYKQNVSGIAVANWDEESNFTVKMHLDEMHSKLGRPGSTTIIGEVKEEAGTKAGFAIVNFEVRFINGKNAESKTIGKARIGEDNNRRITLVRNATKNC